MSDLERAARGMLAMWDAVVAEAMNSSIRQDALDRIADLRAALERQTCECSHVPTKDPASCAIHDGAKGDGIIDDTEAIQAVTDATTKPDAPQVIPREVEQIAYPQEHDRAERAIDLLMRLLQHAWVPENLACRCAFCQLLGDVNIFVREIDGKPDGAE